MIYNYNCAWIHASYDHERAERRACLNKFKFQVKHVAQSIDIATSVVAMALSFRARAFMPGPNIYILTFGTDMNSVDVYTGFKFSTNQFAK
jgi:hypothetical protein